MPWTQRLRRRFFGGIGSAALGLAIRWARNKDAAALERAGAKLGRLLFRLSRKHRERALSNLELAFPEMPSAERLALARRVFEHFGVIASTFVATESRTPEEILASVQLEGREHMEAALAKGKGVLLLTGHFGNWERFAHFGVLNGARIAVVVRDADHPGLQSRVARLRSAAGVEILSRGNAARAILGALKRELIVGLLPDQNSEESFLPFFGLPTGTVLGPAVLHLRAGAPLVPVFCVRVGVGQYRAEIEPPLEPLPGFATPQEGLMAAFNATLERAIRRNPEQWLWFHDRWKSSRQKGLL